MKNWKIFLLFQVQHAVRQVSAGDDHFCVSLNYFFVVKIFRDIDHIVALQVMADCCPIGEDIRVYVMGMDGRGVRLTRFSHLLTMPYVSSRRQAAMAAAITTTNSTGTCYYYQILYRII